MADLALANSTYAAGTIDTASTLVNNVSATDAQQWNGVATACVGIENILGNATDLKGTAVDLVARLAVLLQASGRIKDKDNNPTYNKYDGWLGYGTDTLRKFRNLGFPGEIVMSSLSTVPAGWLECNGQEVSCTTYEDLFDMCAPDLTSTGVGYRYTATPKPFSPSDVNTTTDTITISSHGLSNGNVVYLQTGSTLPSPLVANTKYYIISATTNTFQLSSTLNGSPIDLTSQGTGTHNLHSTFIIPDYRSRSPIGAGQASGLSNRVLNTTYGAETHTLSVSELPAHSHTISLFERLVGLAGYTGFGALGVSGVYPSTPSTNNTGGGAAHNNMHPVFGIKFLVRY
jgi:microcystin-dependent protein